jgi:hypothetical protein
MQIDEDMAGTADTVEHIVGDIRMTPLSKAFMVGRFSLDVRSTHEREGDCKLSVKTVV